MNNIKLPAAWLSFLEQELQSPYFANIKSNYLLAKKANLVFPKGDVLFNAFNLTPLDSLKIILIGQDPYHNYITLDPKDLSLELKKYALRLDSKIILPQAMGLSFSTPSLIKPPPSLKNIFKELESSIDFKIPLSGDLTNWAKNGMLLLNSVLSVQANSPNSHSKKSKTPIGWEDFTDGVIKKLSSRFSDLVFVLLGEAAKKKQALIDPNKHIILKAPHPSPLARGFIGSGIFKELDLALKSRGIKFDFRL